MKRIAFLSILLPLYACSGNVVREDKIPAFEFKVEFDTMDSSNGCRTVHVDDVIGFGDRKAVVKTESLGSFVLPFDAKSGSFRLRRLPEIPEGAGLKSNAKLNGEVIDITLDVARQELAIYHTEVRGKEYPRPSHCRLAIRMDDYPKALTYLKGLQSGTDFSAPAPEAEEAVPAPASKK
jgi:hypothetical protein